MGDYTKHIWERGDTITVDLLNNIENNIATLMDNTNEASTDINTLTNITVKTTDIVDNLTSENSEVPLSANQGRILNTSIANLNDTVSNHTLNLIEHATAITNLNNAIAEKYTKPATGIPASDLASGVIPDISNKQNAPAVAGTAGQVLGLNSNLAPEWIDQNEGNVKTVNGELPDANGNVVITTSLDPEEIAPAISNWLDEHPEATTSIEDGSISYAKLTSSLQDKADGIDEITTESYSRYNVLSPEWLPTGTIKNVEITRNDDVFTFTGTASGSDSDFGSDLDLIPGAKYTVKIYTTSAKTINASIRYRNSSNVETNLASFGTQLNTPVTVTVPSTYSRIYIKLGVVNSNVYSGETYRISLALGETNPKYEKYGEGTSAYDGYSRVFLNKLNTDLKNISTFVTPEQFGAKGNGTSDDTAALNACLTYAITNSIPVFGANTYKVTSAIEIDCDDMSIYIHRINSAASIACALSLTGSRNNLIIDRIYTTNSVGFRLLSTPTRVTQNNYIKSQSIYASGNAIEVYGVPVDNTDATLISYNTFMLNNVQSANGNCIVNGASCAENQFYNAKLKGENGWGIYEPRAMRCYGFSLESDLLNGIYMSAGCSGTFIGFRHTELTDKLVYRMLGQSSYTGGTLIKILGRFNQQFTYIASQYIPYQAIDTSEIVDYTDPTIDIDPPNDWFAKWTRFNLSTRSSIIMGNIRYGMYATQNGGFPLGDNITICAGKKICRPLVESSYTITTADFDMRDDYTSDDNCWPWATTFVIDVADCEIHLSPSYCCLGYNKLTIDQSTSGKLCTIYNSYDDDVPIFDGTTLSAGVYTLSCSCDLDAAADQIPGTSNYYTGRNDLWTVRDSTGAIVSTYRYVEPEETQE